MNLFRRKVDPDVDKRIEVQKRESEATLEYVKQVLVRKDELLAEAINQTGRAVRRKAPGGRPL